MSLLRFEVPLNEQAGFRADATLGDSVFQVLIEPRDLRRLRSSLMDIARISAGKPGRRGILILEESSISADRLSAEWEALQAILKPEILDQLAMVIHRDSKQAIIFGRLSPEERENLEEVILHERQQAIQKPRRPTQAFFDILRVLLIHWVQKSTPLTSKELSEETGFTYPTISNALGKTHPLPSATFRPSGGTPILPPRRLVQVGRTVGDHTGNPSLHHSLDQASDS